MLAWGAETEPESEPESEAGLGIGLQLDGGAGTGMVIVTRASVDLDIRDAVTGLLLPATGAAPGGDAGSRNSWRDPG